MVKRGEVYMAELEPRSGSEQRGRRPVIVISHDAFNSVPSWSSLIVIPVSSSHKQKSRLNTSILLPQGAGGLSQESVALCHQITTLDRAKIGKRIGELSSELMNHVRANAL